MKNIIFLLMFCVTTLYGESIQDTMNIPTVFINQSVDVITGSFHDLLDDQSSSKKWATEYYQAGRNDVGDIGIDLNNQDWRIGKVKLQRLVQSESNVGDIIFRFFYYPGYTEVLDQSGFKTIYAYSKQNYITAISQVGDNTPDAVLLKRTERLYWDNATPLRLVCRTLEDGRGQLDLGKHFEYDDRGNLIKETLFGNLSGCGSEEVSISPEGVIIDDSELERYSTAYEYSLDFKPLLLKKIEDNGLTTRYFYDSRTQKCLCELTLDGEKIHQRTFYSYDDNGFLYKTVKDDGSGELPEDLSGVAHREATYITPYEIAPGIFLPGIMEKKYFDSASGKEILIERRENTYSREGRLVKEEMFDGSGISQQIINRQYDAEGRVVAVQYSSGQFETTTYHENGRSITSYDPATKGTTTSYYDHRGHLINMITQSPDQGVKNTSFRYNHEGQKIASIDRFGNETTYEYDGLGRVSCVSYPAIFNESGTSTIPTEQYDYDIANNVTKVIDPNGYHTNKEYNARQQPTLIEYADGTIEKFTYHLDGTLASKKEKNGQVLSYERDCFGRVLVEERTYDGSVFERVSYTYHGSLLESITTLEGCVTKFAYDYAGRKTEIIKTFKEIYRRSTFTYDDKGQLEENQEWFGHDLADCVTKIHEKDSENHVVAIRVEDSQGHIIKRVVKQSEEKRNPTIVERSILCEHGMHALQKETTDQEGSKRTVDFDYRGLPTKEVVKNLVGSFISEKDCIYDANGNKIVEVHTVYSNGWELRKYRQEWRYGALNRIESMVEGDISSNSRQTSYSYNLLGQLEAMTKPDGVKLNYQYNEKGLISSMKASDGSVFYVYHYNEHGKVTLVEDKLLNKKTLRTYNDLDQIVNETLANDLTFSSSYDKQGRKTKTVLPDRSSIIFSYDEAFLREIKRISPENIALYTHLYRNYDTQGNLTESQLIGSLGSAHFEYDDKGRSVGIKTPYWSETIPADGYDINGNLTKQTISDFEASKNKGYYYFDRQQLTAELSSDAITYAYDSLYNRISKGAGAYEIDGYNQLIHDGEVAYRYDNNGNLIEKKAKDQKTIFRYDALNRLIRVQQPRKFIVKYSYDAFNRRLTKTRDYWNKKESKWIRTGSFRFLFDGDKEIGVVDDKGSILELRVLGLGLGAEIGAAVAVERQGHVYAPIHDHQGSVRCLVDMQVRKAVEYYRYSAFGEEEIFNGEGDPLTSSEIRNPWRFSSKRVDRETGFIYFGNRFYDPLVGRWITPDPIGSTGIPNLYTYVKNNPLTHVDLHGLFSIGTVFNSISWFGYYVADVLARASSSFGSSLLSELDLSEETRNSIDERARNFLGEVQLLLLGYGLDESTVDVTGNGEVSDKVRVTLINGILNRYQAHMENANEVSKLHGGENVHYIFHATGGWTWDMLNCVLAKFGVVTTYSRRLAQKWKILIQEMGGTEGGGKIVHYAHSLGAVDTACARNLLTPEEQKMIYVYTFGSPKMIDEKGYGGAQNYASWRDGVTWYAVYGYAKSLMTGRGSFQFVGSPMGIPLIDHGFLGHGYYPILHHLGTQFQQEYGITLETENELNKQNSLFEN